MRNIVLVLTVAALTPFTQSSSSYHVTHTYTLGGDGNWDYVVPDPPNHRLFIARENRVMVVDENDGTLLGEVTGIHGEHRSWICDGGKRQVGRDVRAEDVQGTRPDPRR